MHDVVHLQPPARVHFGTNVISGGKIVAVRVKLLALMNGKSGIIDRFSIYKDLSAIQVNAIAWDSNHALHKMLSWLHGIAKDNDVIAPDLRIRQKGVPDASLSVMDLIDEQIIANKQRLFHRLRWDLKGLGKESNHKYCKNNCG